MKKLILIFALCFGIAPFAAMADFYRADGGGYYELYVSDCSMENMRRALDSAVAERKAVITSVKCIADAEPNIIDESDLEIYGWEIEYTYSLTYEHQVTEVSCGC